MEYVKVFQPTKCVCENNALTCNLLLCRDTCTIIISIIIIQCVFLFASARRFSFHFLC